jgi:hypothetical protein
MVMAVQGQHSRGVRLLKKCSTVGNPEMVLELDENYDF